MGNYDVRVILGLDVQFSFTDICIPWAGLGMNV